MMLRGGSRAAAYAPAASRASASAASAASAAAAGAAALRRRRRPSRPAAANAAADAATSPSPQPAAALALAAPALVPTPGATADPAVRPPHVRGRRLPVHPFDAVAMAVAAAANRAVGLPLATALDRHVPAVFLLCAAAASLAALGFGAASSASALLALDPSAAVPSWARQALSLASETGGAAEIPWLGLAAALAALPLAGWALARPWWLSSTDACYSLLLRVSGGSRAGGGAAAADASSSAQASGLVGARLLLAWALSAARLVFLSRAAEACGAAWRGGGGAGAPAALAAAVVLAALAVAPVAAAAVVGLPPSLSRAAKDSSSDNNNKSSSSESSSSESAPAAAAAALALLGLELSWLVLRAAQTAFAPASLPTALAAALGAALFLYLWSVHARSVRPRVDGARAKKGDAVRVHVTARLAWDSNGFGAGAAFDGTGRKGIGRDMDDPDREGVPIVVQLGAGGGGGGEGAAAEGDSLSPSADGGGEEEDAGRVLLPRDEAERLAGGRTPATAAGRLAGFGPALARALEGALPGERVVVRARIAGPDDLLVEERTRRWGAVKPRGRRRRGGGGGGKSGQEAPHPDDAPVRYFHPGLEALLTMPEARVLVYGRDAARNDPRLFPGDGLLLPVGGDGTAPRGAFDALDGELGATGRVPGVVIEVGLRGVRASGNAVLAGRRVELEARVETVLRGEDPRRPTMLV